MLTTNYIISQVIFAIGAVLGAIGAQQKVKKNILIFFLGVDFCRIYWLRISRSISRSIVAFYDGSFWDH